MAAMLLPGSHAASIVIPMYDTKVLDLGGSLVAPDSIAIDFLKNFKQLVNDYLANDSSRRLIMVIGGGGPARKYQEAYRMISSDSKNDEADWIGIAATRLNAGADRRLRRHTLRVDSAPLGRAGNRDHQSCTNQDP